MSANAKQVGGDHYKTGGEEHWDRVHRLKLDYFQAQITKYVERAWLKNGVQDLLKAQHVLEKYIELKGTPTGITPADMNSAINELIKEAPLFGADEPMGWNPEHAPLASFPKPSYPNVKPTGWVGFTFEGATKDWTLYTCKTCKKEVRAAPEHDPHDYHKCTLD